MINYSYYDIPDIFLIHLYRLKIIINSKKDKVTFVFPGAENYVGDIEK